MAVYDKQVSTFFKEHPYSSVRECGRKIHIDSSRVSDSLFRMGIHSEHSSFDRKAKYISLWVHAHGFLQSTFIPSMARDFHVTERTCRAWIKRLIKFHFKLPSDINQKIQPGLSAKKTRRVDRFARYAHHIGVMDKDEREKAELMHLVGEPVNLKKIHQPTEYLPFSPDMLEWDKRGHSEWTENLPINS